jgi:hypothetical protein
MNPELKSRIAAAKDNLTLAEKDLEQLIRELDTADRADKRMISDRLKLAFAKLVQAKAELADVLDKG